MQEDTIVAISTPKGIGGLGIVRLSGPEAINIAEKIFSPRNKKKIVSQLPTFSVHLGYIVTNVQLEDIPKGTVLDEVLMTIMRAPHSYTCEDVVEFSCHGGMVVLNKLVELCIHNGARMALPGEFTKRAFLNGRIDISQAEAVCEIIYSKTVLQNNLAIHSLLGKTKNSITPIIEQAKETVAMMELYLDFPEEDDTENVNLKEILQQTLYLNNKLDMILKNTEKLLPIISGFNVAIIGKTNVGKSSLLNILLNHERAIVSEIPGTTRDTISETINLYGVPVRIVDTAGIRSHSQDVIEQLGIERTKQAICEAETIILLLDASTGITSEDIMVQNILNDTVVKTKQTKNVIVAVNKIDLLPEYISENSKQLQEFTNKFVEGINLVKPLLGICCKNRQTCYGIDELEKLVVFCSGIDFSLLTKKSPFDQDAEPDLLVTNLRQKELILSAKNEIQKALTIDIKTNPEIFCEHLKTAVKELSKICGHDIETFSEEILSTIFSKFCVGK